MTTHLRVFSFPRLFRLACGLKKQSGCSWVVLDWFGTGLPETLHHFDIALGHFDCTLANFGSTLGYFACTLGHFAKGLGKVWERFGKGLGEVWDRFGRGLGEVWEGVVYRYPLLANLIF